jgi:hypothetical protein
MFAFGLNSPLAPNKMPYLHALSTKSRNVGSKLVSLKLHAQFDVVGCCFKIDSCITTKNFAACSLVKDQYGSYADGTEYFVNQFVYIQANAFLNSSSANGSHQVGVV